MSGFNTIVPLGENCNITFLLQAFRIKKETGLFEWFASNTLSAIVHVLHHVANRTQPNIEQHGGNVHLGTSDIFSAHYSASEFVPIYARRAERLYTMIQQNPRLLFIRFETKPTTTIKTEDIDKFLNVVKMINPDTSQMKLLWITPSKIPIDHPFVIYKHCPYQTMEVDPYHNINSPTSQMFIQYLKEVGYDTSDIITDIFTDKSIV